jgi:putative MFS transporter
MGIQSSALGIICMRFLVGIGLGIELVTIDAYLSELVPKRMRSSAFAFAFFVQFLSVPAVALMSWWLVPQAPFGVSGWRWVVLASAVFALFIWWLRKRLPESPRWLAQHGRFDEANGFSTPSKPAARRIIANRWMRLKPFRWMSRARAASPISGNHRIGVGR